MDRPVRFRAWLRGATALLALALSGCFEVDTLVLVHADGRGTVTERTLLKGPLAELVGTLSDEAEGRVDPGDLEARARRMGPGVRVRRFAPLPGDRGIGYEVVFAFDDVNTLRVNQSPQPLGNGKDDPQAGEPFSQDSFATFRLEPGPRPVLTVFTHRTPERGEDRREDGSARRPGRGQTGEDGKPGALPAMLARVLGGLEVSVAVAVEGTIVETNASHREGDRVTLLALDLDRILEAPEALATLEDLRARDLASQKEMMKRFPGVEVELEPEVHIVFEPRLRRAAVPPGWLRPGLSPPAPGTRAPPAPRA